MGHRFAVQRASSLLWSILQYCQACSIMPMFDRTQQCVRSLCSSRLQVHNAAVLHLQPFLLIPRLTMHPPPLPLLPSRFSHCPGTTAATDFAAHRAPLASAAPAGPRRTILASTAMGGRLTRQSQSAPTAGMLRRNQVQISLVFFCILYFMCVYSRQMAAALFAVLVLVTKSRGTYCCVCMCDTRH